MNDIDLYEYGTKAIEKKYVNGEYYALEGEDGILEKICEELNIAKGNFVEFGGWDGVHLSNCFLLVKSGWGGLYIESNPQKSKECDNNMSKYENVFSLNSRVSLESGETLDEILPKYNIFNDGVTLMSIDIDSCDYWVWGGLKNYKPIIVIIETPGKYRDLNDFRVKKYNPNGGYPDFHGCTMNAMHKLGYHLGYEPICMTKCNTIFILKEYNIRDGEKIFTVQNTEPHKGQKLLTEVELNSYNQETYVDGNWIVNPKFTWGEQLKNLNI